jgi:hypothetical protein
MKGTYLCPMKTFYFSRDVPFTQRLKTAYADLRQTS